MNYLKFILASDPCLDAPFIKLTSGSENLRLQQTLANAPGTSFRRLVDLCVDEAVDFLIITGKIFIKNPVEPALLQLLEKSLKKLAGARIQIFLTEPLPEALSFEETAAVAEKIHVFSGSEPAAVPVPRGGNCLAIVQGMAKTQGLSVSELIPLFRRDENLSCIQIAVVPFPIAEQAGDEPDAATVAELAQTGLDAIFSNHASRRALLDEKPLIAFPGPLSPHSPKETGAHGCLLIEQEQDPEKPLKTRFIELSPVMAQELSLDISGLTQTEQLESLLAESLRNLLKTASSQIEILIANIKLHGATSLDSWLRMPESRENLSALLSRFTNCKPAILFSEISVASQPIKAHGEVVNLVSEMARISMTLEKNDDDLKTFALSSFADLLKYPELEKTIRNLDPAEMRKLLASATTICAAALEGE